MDAKTRGEVRALVLRIVGAWPGLSSGNIGVTAYAVDERIRRDFVEAALQHHRRAGRIRYDRERRGWVPVDGGK